MEITSVLSVCSVVKKRHVAFPPKNKNTGSSGVTKEPGAKKGNEEGVERRSCCSLSAYIYGGFAVPVDIRHAFFQVAWSGLNSVYYRVDNQALSGGFARVA